MTRSLNALRFGVAAALVAGLYALAPSDASAQDARDVQDTSTFRLTGYFYLPNLGGTTSFPTPAGSTIDVKADTLIENTDVAAMAAFEVQKGRVGGFVDAIFFDLGVNKSGTRDLTIPGVPVPLPVSADASMDIEATLGTAAASFRVASGRSGVLDIFGGVRRLEIESTLDYTLSAPVGPFAGATLAGSGVATNHNWDGIGGVKGRVAFGNFFVPYYADAGTGDSDLTWQAMTGFGYAFRHVEIGGVYRYLAYEMKEDRKIADLNFSGPALGVTFKW